MQILQVTLVIQGDDPGKAKQLAIAELETSLNQWFTRETVPPFPEGSLLSWSIADPEEWS